MRPGVEQIRSLGDPQRVYNWDLSFEKMPTVLLGYTSDEINFRCESTELPKVTNQKITRNIRGIEVRDPGYGQYNGQITLTMHEMVDSKIKKIIRAWRLSCHNSITGTHLSKRDCEAIIKISLLDGNNKMVFNYRLLGCWLEDFDLGTLGSESEVQKPSMVLSYDYFIENELV